MNGGDINGLFNNPVLEPDLDTFHFFDAVFQARVDGPASKTLDDMLSVDVTAKPGWQISWMTVEARGSYALSGPSACASFTGTLGMQELGVYPDPQPARTWSMDMVTVPNLDFQYCGPDSGSWTGSATVDVSSEFPAPRDQIRISLSNHLWVSSEVAGQSAELNVQYEYLDITFGVIPEPASLALLAFGGLVLARRRG